MKMIVSCGSVFLAAGAAAAQQVLTEVRPADMGAYAAFGRSLAAQQGLALAGAPGENALGAESGAVHVLRLAFGAWAEETLLLAADGAGGDRFGESAALDGDRALIGAPEVPGTAALAGTTAHHAFAVLDVSQGTVTFVSNPAPLVLTD